MSTPAAKQLSVLFATAVLVFATLFSPCARADDVSVGVILPGLRSDPAGSVTGSAASVVLRDGNIDLTLATTVRNGVRASVTIEMPRFGWLGEGEPYPGRHFPELRILVGGVPAALESSFTAFVGSTDVTDAIRAAAVDPFVIADTPPFVTADADSTLALERLGAIERSGDYYVAKWTARRTVRVALGAASNQTLTLIYKARPGYDLLRFDQLSVPARLTEYCLAASSFRQFLGHPAAATTFAVLEYVIPAGIDNTPPPTVAVEVGPRGKEEQPRSLVAFCGTDGKAVIGREADVRAPARTDAEGRIRLLLVGVANRSK